MSRHLFCRESLPPHPALDPGPPTNPRGWGGLVTDGSEQLSQAGGLGMLLPEIYQTLRLFLKDGDKCPQEMLE